MSFAKSFAVSFPWAGLIVLPLSLAIGGACAANAQTVPTYHADAARSGRYVVPQLTTSAAKNMHHLTSFSGAVSGPVYAQPLYWLPPNSSTAYVIVATETNNVYALNAETGAVHWHTSLGPSVPAGQLPCGNINPVGVTGTPVIDETTQTLFVAALLDESSGPTNKVFALDLANGKIQSGWPLDVGAALTAKGKSFNSLAQEQRSALAIADNNIYVTYSGRDGDCGTYHGWVVGISTTSPKLIGNWATGAAKGGIWGQGGAAFDGTYLFVTTGNTSGATQWGGGEAVIRFGSSLSFSANKTTYFAPSDWLTLDNEDLDLGGTGPLPIQVPVTGGSPLNQLIQFGKDGNAYLLNREQLGGIGGQLSVRQVSNGQIRNAGATYQTQNAAMVTILTPGTTASGLLQMFSVTSNKQNPITPAWAVNLNGLGAPIVTVSAYNNNVATDPIVWIVGAEGDNVLHGYNATNGATLHTDSFVMGGLHHMQTFLYAASRFYVAGDNNVYAFGF